VTSTGLTGGNLLGIITGRDMDFISDPSTKIKEIMTKRDDLVVADYGINLDDAYKIMSDTKMGKLPIVNQDNELMSLISRTDLKKSRDFPSSTKGEDGKLLVGAAIGTRDTDKERLECLVKAGVDIVVIDSS